MVVFFFVAYGWSWLYDSSLASKYLDNVSVQILETVLHEQTVWMLPASSQPPRIVNVPSLTGKKKALPGLSLSSFMFLVIFPSPFSLARSLSLSDLELHSYHCQTVMVRVFHASCRIYTQAWCAVMAHV